MYVDILQVLSACLPQSSQHLCRVRKMVPDPGSAPGHGRNRQTELSAMHVCGYRVTTGCGWPPELCPDGVVAPSPGGV